MFFQINFFSFIFLLLTVFNVKAHDLAPGFVYLTDIDPTIIENARYATDQNFLGRIVPGYTSKKIVCTQEAALALKKAHDDFKALGYTVVVYDGYRPQRSVDAFIKWAYNMKDQSVKDYYYPTIDKRDVFKLDYIAKKSSHTRGSTFDLTLITTGETVKPIVYQKRSIKHNTVIPFLDDNTLDMGSSFDLFHEISNNNSDLITEKQKENRALLRNIMTQHGFKGAKSEWWHYTLVNEPYPNTYFNFIVK